DDDRAVEGSAVVVTQYGRYMQRRQFDTVEGSARGIEREGQRTPESDSGTDVDRIGDGIAVDVDTGQRDVLRRRLGPGAKQPEIDRVQLERRTTIGDADVGAVDLAMQTGRVRHALVGRDRERAFGDRGVRTVREFIEVERVPSTRIDRGTSSRGAIGAEADGKRAAHRGGGLRDQCVLEDRLRYRRGVARRVVMHVDAEVAGSGVA